MSTTTAPGARPSGPQYPDSDSSSDTNYTTPGESDDDDARVVEVSAAASPTPTANAGPGGYHQTRLGRNIAGGSGGVCTPPADGSTPDSLAAARQRAAAAGSRPPARATRQRRYDDSPASQNMPTSFKQESGSDGGDGSSEDYTTPGSSSSADEDGGSFSGRTATARKLSPQLSSDAVDTRGVRAPQSDTREGLSHGGDSGSTRDAPSHGQRTDSDARQRRWIAPQGTAGGEQHASSRPPIQVRETPSSASSWMSGDNGYDISGPGEYSLDGASSFGRSQDTRGSYQSVGPRRSVSRAARAARRKRHAAVRNRNTRLFPPSLFLDFAHSVPKPPTVPDSEPDVMQAIRQAGALSRALAANEAAQNAAGMPSPRAGRHDSSSSPRSPQPFSTAMGSASQRRVRYRQASAKRRTDAHEGKESDSRRRESYPHDLRSTSLTAPVAPTARQVRPRPSPITTRRPKSSGGVKTGRPSVRGGTRKVKDPQPAAIVSRASEVSLDTRDSLKSTRMAIIMQEVLSVRQENNRLFQERNRVREMCLAARRQLNRLRENLERVCFTKGEVAEDHLVRIGVGPELFDGPLGAPPATGGAVRSAISFADVLGKSATDTPHSPRSPQRTSPVRSSTVSTGLAAANAAALQAELEADPFHHTKQQALTRVVHLDTPASLAVVASGASGTDLLETGKRGELEDIVAELAARKQLQLAQHQFRNRQLKHMEMRARDELRAMQQSIRKRTQAARELSVQGIARAEQTLADERRSIAKLQADIQSLRTQVGEVKAARDDALEERTTAMEELKGIRRLRKQAQAQRAELKERFSQGEVRERELAKQVADAQAAQKILEERLQRRKAHIKAFYDVIARIQAQTGISDMNTIASQFFSQEEQYDQMVVRLQDQAEQLEELQREEKEIKVHLNKLRVYGAYKGRHSKLDEKDQELQLAEAAARREETLWRGRRRLFVAVATGVMSVLGLLRLSSSHLCDDVMQQYAPQLTAPEQFMPAQRGASSSESEDDDELELPAVNGPASATGASGVGTTVQAPLSKDATATPDGADGKTGAAAVPTSEAPPSDVPAKSQVSAMANAGAASVVGNASVSGASQRGGAGPKRHPSRGSKADMVRSATPAGGRRSQRSRRSVSPRTHRATPGASSHGAADASAESVHGGGSVRGPDAAAAAESKLTVNATDANEVWAAQHGESLVVGEEAGADAGGDEDNGALGDIDESTLDEQERAALVAARAAEAKAHRRELRRERARAERAKRRREQTGADDLVVSRVMASGIAECAQKLTMIMDIVGNVARRPTLTSGASFWHGYNMRQGQVDPKSAAMAAALDRAKNYPHGANPGGDTFADILLQFEQPMGNNIRCSSEAPGPRTDPSSSSDYDTSSSDGDLQGMLRTMNAVSDTEGVLRPVASVRSVVTEGDGAAGAGASASGRRRQASAGSPVPKGRRSSGRDRRDSLDARDDSNGVPGRPMSSHMARRMARLGVNTTASKSAQGRDKHGPLHRRSASRASDGGDAGTTSGRNEATVTRSATMRPRYGRSPRRQNSSRTLTRRASRSSRVQAPVDTKAQKNVIGQLEAARTSSISPNTGRRRRLVPPVLSSDGMPDREFLKTRHQYFRDAHAIREAMAKRLLKRRKESMHALQRQRMSALAGTGNSSASLYDN